MGRKVGSSGRAEFELSGERTRATRTGLGLSQQAVADRVEVSRAMLSQLETGKTRATAQLVAKLAEALETTPEHLCAGWEGSAGTPLPVPRTAFAVEVQAPSMPGMLHQISLTLVLLGLDILAVETTSTPAESRIKVSVTANEDIGIGKVASQLAAIDLVTDVSFGEFFVKPSPVPPLPEIGEVSYCVTARNRRQIVPDLAEVMARAGVNLGAVAAWVCGDSISVWFTCSEPPDQTLQSIRGRLAAVRGFRKLCTTRAEL